MQTRLNFDDWQLCYDAEHPLPVDRPNTGTGKQCVYIDYLNDAEIYVGRGAQGNRELLVTRNDVHFRRVQNMERQAKMLRIVVAVNLCDADSSLLETRLIKHWGIKSLGGTLTNQNNGEGFERGQLSGLPKVSPKTIKVYVDRLNDIMNELPSDGFISKHASRNFITDKLKCSPESTKDTHWCLVATNILRKVNSDYELCETERKGWKCLSPQQQVDLINKLWNVDWVNGTLPTNL
jgi:hypothetical protein